MSRNRIIGTFVICLLVVANVAWLIWMSQRRHQPTSITTADEADIKDITAGVPIQRGRIDEYIQAVQNETLEQSIENLGFHENLLVRAGLVDESPVPWPRCTERCLANRRLARVFEAFSKLPSDERSRRSKQLFDKTQTEFFQAVELILSRWETGNPPKTVTELFGEHRSIDGYFWAVCGSQLLCAQFCPVDVAIQNQESILQFHQKNQVRVQQNPDRLALPYSEIEQFLAPDLFQLNVLRLLCGRQSGVNRLDPLIPAEMRPEETRFYAWNAHTNEQDFTHQRRNVAPDESRILQTFSFYHTWHDAGQADVEARRTLVDHCWTELKPQLRG